MAISLDQGVDGIPVVKISGQFDFRLMRDFVVVSSRLEGFEQCVVDLAAATNIDSSALGMLLLLREQVTNVRIVRPSSRVQRELEVANFATIFSIES